MRRTKKIVTHKEELQEDKKFKSTIKKYGKYTHLVNQVSGMQPLSDIDEVNMFKDDNTVIHFKRPTCK